MYIQLEWFEFESFTCFRNSYAIFRILCLGVVQNFDHLKILQLLINIVKSDSRCLKKKVSEKRKEEKRRRHLHQDPSSEKQAVHKPWDACRSLRRPFHFLEINFPSPLTGGGKGTRQKLEKRAREIIVQLNSRAGIIFRRLRVPHGDGSAPPHQTSFPGSRDAQLTGLTGAATIVTIPSRRDRERERNAPF